jgi:hypothetical protein
MKQIPEELLIQLWKPPRSGLDLNFRELGWKKCTKLAEKISFKECLLIAYSSHLKSFAVSILDLR